MRYPARYVEWRDETGAWVRPMEQRFRAFAQGGITLGQFLDTEAVYVFQDEDGEMTTCTDWRGVEVDGSLAECDIDPDGYTPR